MTQPSGAGSRARLSACTLVFITTVFMTITTNLHDPSGGYLLTERISDSTGYRHVPEPTVQSRNSTHLTFGGRRVPPSACRVMIWAQLWQLVVERKGSAFRKPNTARFSVNRRREHYRASPNTLARRQKPKIFRVWLSANGPGTSDSFRYHCAASIAGASAHHLTQSPPNDARRFIFHRGARPQPDVTNF